MGETPDFKHGEPEPIKNDNSSIHDLVISDMEERKRFGYEKYQTYLQAHNGRKSLVIRHNIEVAHRLFLTKGKCEQIHGHSMWVDLELFTPLGTSNGMYANLDGNPLEFGHLKKQFRHFLDTTYDHRLLLNRDDPFSQPVYTVGFSGLVEQPGEDQPIELPGLVKVDGDPTTENIAQSVADWAGTEFVCDVHVIVHETSVNAASAFAFGRRSR